MNLLKTTLFAALLLGQSCLTISAQNTPVSQMETLNRGLIVLPASGNAGNYISWRFLGTDSPEISFDLLRDGKAVATDLTVTNYTDAEGTATSFYQVVAKVNGTVLETTPSASSWGKIYKTLTLDRPANLTVTGGEVCSYSPNDMSVGDVDGDGEYELFVKWDPSNSKDNSQNGYTGNVYIDCYRLSGERLWRIDLGKNIRAGAHYTQFLVYDFDSDGRAEMICKTAPGSLDATGKYVNQAATDDEIKNADNSKDHRNSSGRLVSGQEYLTAFNGLTGEAVHTVFYNPNRDASYGGEGTGTFNWDDRSGKKDYASYGNRGERHLATVAYLAGADQRPSGVFVRGYYTYAYVWAVDFDGAKLSQRWFHASDSKTKYKVTDISGNTTEYTAPASKAGLGLNTMYANGNHNISVGDVDGDGKDEVVWGSAALDDDGRLLYAVGFGHGDAIHLADMDPDRPGLELFDIHENKGDYAWDIHDAATGEIIWKGGQKGQDNGRGMAADIIGSSRGYEFWSAYGGMSSTVRDQNPYNIITGEAVGSKKPAMNFRIYWDGDELDELFDGCYDSKTTFKSAPMITKFKQNGNSSSINTLLNISQLGDWQSCNTTKATPCLQADILGDWREEVILWSYSSPEQIAIFSSNIPSDYRVPCLMHDHTYRMGVAWQNVGYNQPPHLGYYLPDYLDGNVNAISELSSDATMQGDAPCYNLSGQRVLTPTKGVYVKNGKKIVVGR
ncbi:MAG: rhamnogalacturonan lyase [Prevotella sp.]|nr:rhamnogalacturonan lyase [Prevotella sp.]